LGVLNKISERCRSYKSFTIPLWQHALIQNYERSMTILRDTVPVVSWNKETYSC
jgi:hypothetical protein